MHLIFYYIIVYLIVGAIGMYLANKKQEKHIQLQRWLKYSTYVVITGIVVASIFANLFYVAAIVIIAAGLFEMLKANFSVVITRIQYVIISLFSYFLIAFGFWKFAETFNQAFLLFIYFQVFVFDGFCQITGQLIGKHKLASKISSAKTVEGLAGGWIFCIISAIPAASWIHKSLFIAIMLGLLTGLTSFTGDVLGSYFKRLVKIKDYSNLLPGQGGFLDRFGSLMMTGAVYYLLQLVIQF